MPETDTGKNVSRGHDTRQNLASKSMPLISVSSLWLVCHGHNATPYHISHFLQFSDNIFKKLSNLCSPSAAIALLCTLSY